MSFYVSLMSLKLLAYAKVRVDVLVLFFYKQEENHLANIQTKRTKFYRSNTHRCLLERFSSKFKLLNLNLNVRTEQNRC